MKTARKAKAGLPEPQAPIEKTCHLNEELAETEELLAAVAWGLLEQQREEADGIRAAVKQVTGREVWGVGGILDQAGRLHEMWRANIFIAILEEHVDDLLDRIEREKWAKAEAAILARKAEQTAKAA